MIEAVFIPDGDVLIPQPTAAGPWFPGVQHGGAVTGLIARAVEMMPSAQPMMLTRMSVDLSRKVPMGPTRVTAEILRDGKRVQSLAVSFEVDGEIVARSTAIRIRIDESVVPPDRVPDWPEDEPPVGPDELDNINKMVGGPDFVDNFTMRRREDETEPGRAVSWVKLDVPFVLGEPTQPMTFAAAAADMIPSAGSIMDFNTHISVNPDLSMQFHRVPVGDWIGSAALVRVNPGGFGSTDAQLFDQTSSIGRSMKSLLIDPRDPAN
ncbi:MAG: thioesterase family protein [Acidimicrobiales bacterium]|jgi:acyl-CoA thioesterase|nr:thioesterase family protein [Acidimicrobiales bacterium]